MTTLSPEMIERREAAARKRREDWLASFPRLLVMETGGDPVYYHVPDEAMLHRLSLQVMRDRTKYNWYSPVGEYAKLAEKSGTEVKALERAIEVLPADNHERKRLEKDVARMRRNLADCAQLEEWNRLREHALNSLNGALAWKLMSEKAEFADDRDFVLEHYSSPNPEDRE